MNTQEDTHDQVEDWRSIVLLGANVATYKFALGHSLLELAREDAAAITVGDLETISITGLNQPMVFS